MGKRLDHGAHQSASGDGGPDVIELGSGERFYTLAGVGQLLGLTEQSARRYHAAGKLQGVTVGKRLIFSDAAVRELLTKGTE